MVHACCGCGKAKQLKVCGRCRVAKRCGPECAKRMWPLHKAFCKQWAAESEADTANCGNTAEEAQRRQLSEL